MINFVQSGNLRCHDTCKDYYGVNGSWKKPTEAQKFYCSSREEIKVCVHNTMHAKLSSRNHQYKLLHHITRWVLEIRVGCTIARMMKLSTEDTSRCTTPCAVKKTAKTKKHDCIHGDGNNNHQHVKNRCKLNLRRLYFGVWSCSIGMSAHPSCFWSRAVSDLDDAKLKLACWRLKHNVVSSCYIACPSYAASGAPGM